MAHLADSILRAAPGDASAAESAIQQALRLAPGDKWMQSLAAQIRDSADRQAGRCARPPPSLPVASPEGVVTRRQILTLPALAAAARAQRYGGMASRGVAPVPRGKPSGLPFHARFTNVAAAAGLRAPVIYGDEGKADYILESMGCGVAFLDYDNDGWQDIVVLTGRRRSGPTPAGRDHPAIPQQSRRDLPRRHRDIRVWGVVSGPRASR